MKTNTPSYSPEQQEKLHALWSKLLDTFITYLKETPPEKRRSSMLSVIRMFLQDNNIKSDGRSLKELVTDAEQLRDLKLPFGSAQ